MNEQQRSNKIGRFTVGKKTDKYTEAQNGATRKKWERLCLKAVAVRSTDGYAVLDILPPIRRPHLRVKDAASEQLREVE